ncbi:ATP-binding protein [Streptomyces radiopugnans]|uniref:Anti-sigma regulatory factor (Ser/Thr protein kinase) n=1 Tax=Streptomyces radiopugnans TaxID=403935 RepID=A0A1H9JUD0_9ACTN|nr:ATP-binding protein [Streptomyces radiopugnans]SEQ90440.1 Anti-sigma regulatory factor (Ser/Thr protein kinase) [Streptomyces radiopugnans]
MNRATPQAGPTVAVFTQLLSSTRRGARLARLLTVTELLSWEVPRDLAERAELVVAELAANAVLHGHVPGRCFRLALTYEPSAGRLTVDVTDARGESKPRVPAPEAGPDDGPDAEADPLRTGGHGLTLVTALADHWDCVPHPPGGKTVRAVLTSPAAGA